MIGLTVAALVAGAIVALLVIGLIKPDQEFRLDRAIGEGKALFAPDLSLPVLVPGNGVGPVGTSVSLSSLRGKPVVMNLWASWCDSCKDEAPILERLAKTYEPRGVVVLGVNVRDLSGNAKAFIDEYKLTIPSLRDGTDRTEKAYDVLGLPETFIIDPDGKVRLLPYRGGLTVGSEKEISSYLDSVLAK